MRVTIPDALADQYQAFADRQGRTLDEVITAQLTRFVGLAPGRRAVVVDEPTLVALDKRFGNIPIKDGADLAQKVLTLAGVKFRNLQFDLSTQQLAELAHRADRQGRKVEDLVLDIFRSLQDQFFHSSGGGVAKVVTAPPPQGKVAKPPTAVADQVAAR